MYTLIAIFYVSLFGIITMIVLKGREVRSGRPLVISVIGRKIDSSLFAFYRKVSQTASFFNKKTFIMVVQLVAYHILLRIRKVYVEIKHRALLNPHGKKVIDAVRGRGEIKNHGASFYLRRIGDK